MKLFLETEVGDITGKIIKTEKEHIFTKEQIQAVFSSFKIIFIDRNHLYTLS